MTHARLRAPAAAAVLLALAACTGPRAAGGPGGPAETALVRLVGNDAAGAGARSREAISRHADDPWAHLAAALLARRGLDPEAEASHLAAVAGAVPEGPLALVALRRLSKLAEHSAGLARRVDGAVAPLLASGRLTGLVAYRARVARIAAAEALGDHSAASALRRENGAVSAWTIAGPFGLHSALDFDRPFPPDEGPIPVSLPGPLGLPPRITRPLPAPDGIVGLDGEPRDGDVFYLAADGTLARGGRYLLAVGTAMSVRVHVDGVRVHERRAFAAHLPTLEIVPLDLAPGSHRILVKASRAHGADSLHLALPRADGSPSDAAFAPAPPSSTAALPAAPRAPAPPGRGGATAREGSAGAGRAVAEALAPLVGEPLASLLAGLDAADHDPEAAKALLTAAAREAPSSALVRTALGGVLSADRTLDPQVARARGEAELREALSRDPENGAARVELATLLVDARRLDEADEVLSGLGDAEARPLALAALARAADARGLAERAEALLEGGLRAGDGSCAALEHARELAARRRAVLLEDARARALLECPGGRERLAEHLRRRGDPVAAREVLLPLAAARPWRVGPAFALAEAWVASGAPSGAVAVLEALRTLWPRDPRIEKRLADAMELAGDPRGARAARERALLLDGSDLALRRALALEDGREVLDHRAEDARAAIEAYRAAARSDDTSSAMVLDAAAVAIHPGGTATERTHQVIHVLDPRGVEQFGEVGVPAGAQVLALRTLKPDGRALEPERAGEEKGTLSLAGLEPGDHVEIEYLRATRGDGAGFAADPFYFRTPGTRLFRSAYVVEAPAGLGLAVDARRVPAPPVVREGALDVVRGLALDVPAHVPEPGGPGLSELLPLLHAGVGGGRDALHRRLAEAVAGRTRSTEELRALARAVRSEAGARAGPAELVRAAAARVSRTVLGSGGAFGDEASVVLSRGRGSRILVLKALLGELGIRARVALARPFTADPSPWRFPPLSLYAHPLLRVELDGEPIWLDPGLRLAPFATVPSVVLDAEALVLPEPGEELEVARTPGRIRVEERRELSVRISIEADGSAVFEGEDLYFGAAGAAAKEGIERLDASERRQVVEAMLARSFRGMSLDEAVWAGEDDAEAPLAIRWRGKVARLARPADGGLLLDGPVLPARLGARYVQVAERETPLLLAYPERIVQRMEIVAPVGHVAAAAPPRTIESPFGTFARTERAEGRSLLREDRLDLSRGRIPPGLYPGFAAFAAGVDAVQELPAAFPAAPAGAEPPASPRR